MLEVLTKLLREEHLILMVRKAYTSIDYGKFKSLFGMNGWQESDVHKFISEKRMRLEDDFVHPGVGEEDRNGGDGERKRF